MAFLQDLDKLPKNDPRRTGLFFKHLGVGWRSLFAELRSQRPILHLPETTLPRLAVFSLRDDVEAILSQPRVFSVGPYKRPMEPSVGPFMLCRDEPELNHHEKSIMRRLLRDDDLPRIRELSERTTAECIRNKQGQLDVISDVARLVPLRVVQEYFGFVGPNPEAVLRWSYATQHDMFRNIFGKSNVHEANVTAGLEMRHWAGALVADRFCDSALGSKDDVLSRLVFAARSDPELLSAERIVSNACGLLVGSIETTQQAIAQSLAYILGDKEITDRAVQAAQQESNDELDAIVWEALRFAPITPFVLRSVTKDATVGGEKLIKTSWVVAGIASAMFDDKKVVHPDQFLVPRPKEVYLHFGFGHHECLGKHVGMQIVPAAIRRLLLLPRLRLPTPAKAPIVWGDAFPEHFVVQFDGDRQ